MNNALKETCWHGLSYCCKTKCAGRDTALKMLGIPLSKFHQLKREYDKEMIAYIMTHPKPLQSTKILNTFDTNDPEAKAALSRIRKLIKSGYLDKLKPAKIRKVQQILVCHKSLSYCCAIEKGCFWTKTCLKVLRVPEKVFEDLKSQYDKKIARL